MLGHAHRRTGSPGGEGVLPLCAPLYPGSPDTAGVGLLPSGPLATGGYRVGGARAHREQQGWEGSWGRGCMQRNVGCPASFSEEGQGQMAAGGLRMRGAPCQPSPRL